MSASDADRGCGRGEASSTAPQPARRVIARQAARPVEQRKRTVLVVMNPNAGFDIVMPVPALRDLKHQARIAHRVVAPDNPILLNTEDARQIADKGHEGVPG